MNVHFPQGVPQNILGIVVLGLCLSSCQTITLNSLPAVPTHRMLPYSVALDITSLKIYDVEPGAATWPLPPLSHYATIRSPSVTLDKAQWKEALMDYLNERKTFQHLVKEGDKADLILDLRVHLFVDPGASYKFDYNYWAHIDGIVKIAQYDREVARQTGFGKAHGNITQSHSEDELFLNRAVLQALDILITKLETDRQLYPSSL
jgi:hypothetical protein